jgi:hypothetical protein
MLCRFRLRRAAESGIIGHSEKPGKIPTKCSRRSPRKPPAVRKLSSPFAVRPPPGGISEVVYRTIDAYHFAKAQLAPKRRVWQAAILGMIGGMVAALTLIEVFAKACN